jgi:hypothetical protein
MLLLLLSVIQECGVPNCCGCILLLLLLMLLACHAVCMAALVHHHHSLRHVGVDIISGAIRGCVLTTACCCCCCWLFRLLPRVCSM